MSLSSLQLEILRLARENQSVFIPDGNTFALGIRTWGVLFGGIEEKTFQKNYVKKFGVPYRRPGQEWIVQPEHLLQRIPLIDPQAKDSDDGEEES